MRGPPFWANGGRMKGRGNMAWITEAGSSPPVRPCLARCLAKNRHSGAPGGERADRKARGRLRKAPRYVRRLGAPLPHCCEGKEKERGAGPAPNERGR